MHVVASGSSKGLTDGLSQRKIPEVVVRVCFFNCGGGDQKLCWVKFS